MKRDSLRDTIEQKTALLVTDDPAVEMTVRNATGEAGDRLRILKTAGEAMSGVLDASAAETFVILDLEARSGRRSLLTTAAGVLPTITVATKTKPWLASMLRRHRVRATLSKPVSSEALKQALREVRRSPGTSSQ